jgi:hypothetical protein
MTKFSARDLISASRWSGLLFTTYGLSLSFFEAVVLDAMLRQQIGDALILADKGGVLSAMSEVGAQQVGRAYDLEPVAVDRGCFHAKLTAAWSDDDAHILIGSGNLTFGGWGANLECIEHIHASFAPEAMLDVASFLRLLSTSAHIHHAANPACNRLADRLTRTAAGKGSPGTVRVLHNIGHSITDQLAGYASELGGARSLTLASPFFDGDGIATLCAALNLSEAFAHVHPAGTVMEHGGTNWPTRPSELLTQAVCIEPLAVHKKRLLHAKLYEIVCERGRLILSGSSNATIPGLSADRNVELCVLRIQPDPFLGWCHEPSAVPMRYSLEQPSGSEGERNACILRATLRASRVEGQILEAFPTGEAEVSIKNTLQWQVMERTTVSAARRFSFGYLDSWKMSRQFQVRLTSSSGQIAQGFVSMPEVKEISKCLGSAAKHFLSLLEHRETAGDIRAIVEYIYDHPDWIANKPTASVHSGGARSTPLVPLVDVDSLSEAVRNDPLHSAQGSPLTFGEDRFIAQVFASLRESRGAIDSTATSVDADVQELDERSKSEKNQSLIDSSKEEAAALTSFERLLRVLLEENPSQERTLKAAAIAQYVCDRLELDALKTFEYLDRITRHFSGRVPGESDVAYVEALALVWASHSRLQGDARINWLRRLMLRIGSDVAGPSPSLAPMGGVLNRLGRTEGIEALWNQVCTTRTIQEEICAYWHDPTVPRDAQQYPLLSQSDAWSELKVGPNKRTFRMEKHQAYCPDCRLSLSTVAASRLRSNGVVRCGGSLLLCEEL